MNLINGKHGLICCLSPEKAFYAAIVKYTVCFQNNQTYTT